MQLSEMVQNEHLINSKIKIMIDNMQQNNKTPAEIQDAKRKVLKWYEKNQDFNEIPDNINKILKGGVNNGK